MNSLQLVHILKNEFYHYYFENDNGVKKSLLQIADKIEELMYGKNERRKNFRLQRGIRNRKKSKFYGSKGTNSISN